MSRNRRLKQRLAAQTCYLCVCSRMNTSQLIHEIESGPGRILWGLRLCDYHEIEKQQRRDEREDRLNAAGLAVTFAERDPRYGLSTGSVRPLDESVVLA